MLGVRVCPMQAVLLRCALCGWPGRQRGLLQKAANLEKKVADVNERAGELAPTVVLKLAGRDAGPAGCSASVAWGTCQRGLWAVRQ